jgi:hypothetical protein
MNAIAEFFDELRTACGQDEVFDECEHATELLEAEAVNNQDASELLRGIAWLMGRNDRTLMERLEAVCKLLNLPPGPIVVNLAELTGW